MLSIAIYSNNDGNISNLRSTIQDFLIELKIIAKVYYFQTSENVIITPNSFDIYILDLDSTNDSLELAQKMYEIDQGSKFICISEDLNQASLVDKDYIDYYLHIPLNQEKMKSILKKIKKSIQDDSIIIQIPGGERRVRANLLNYINIEKRCLCYHLKDGNMFDGQSMRSSFERSIDPLQKHPGFLFIAPSLLINLGEIKSIYNDHLFFENDDVLYFPKKQYDNIHDAWVKYSRIVN